MKFDALHIQRFGHFSNFALDFGDQPFVLLFGHNEAGKTTLLEFLRQLLFGFPERTPYNFGDGGEISGTAQLTLADQRTVELKRRKGRKNPVQARVAGRDAELDDAGFRQLLGNANENVFKTVFAFGLDELRTGNESLKDESLQSALFGGGLGGSKNPEAVLTELDQAAANLFKSAASKPTINALAAELKKLATDIRQKTIRSDEYERREVAWKEAQQTADRLASERDALRQQQGRTERLLTALPRWLRLQANREERKPIIVPPSFPADAEHQFTTISDTLQRLTRELNTIRREMADEEQQLATLPLDQTLLPLRPQIEDCHRSIQSVSEARRDLPLRRDERTKLHADIVHEMNRLRPGWTLDDLRAFTLDHATKHQCDELARRRTILNDTHTRWQTLRDETRSANDQLASDWEGLGSAPDVTALAGILAQAAEYEANQKALKKALENGAKLQRAVVAQRARLSPPLPLETLPIQGQTDSELEQLPVPPRDLAVRFDAELRAAEQRLVASLNAAEDDERQIQLLRRELTPSVHRRQAVPTREELQQQRTTRDDLWRRLRARHIDHSATDADVAKPALTPESYEQAVRKADQTADEIYEHADDVARREQLRRQLEEAEAELLRRQSESEQLAKVRDEIQDRWTELWRPCHLTPLTPDLMVAWLDAFSAFLQAHDAAVQQQMEVATLREQMATFEDRLRAATTPLIAADGDIATLLTSAKQQVRQAEENEQERKRLERERKRLDKILHDSDAELQAWTQADVAWQGEWKTLLQRVGLPETWEVGFARDILGQLAAAQQKLASLAELESRIAKMEQRVAEFDPRVSRLCEQLAISFDSERPEVSARGLQQQLTDATQLQERRLNLETRLSNNRKNATAKEAELQDWQAKREQLLSRANATTDEAFFVVAEQTRRAAKLDAEEQQLHVELALARGRELETEFVAQLQSADQIQLQNELNELALTTQQKQKTAEEAREQAGSLRRAFEELNGRNEAALLQEKLASHQAQLANEIQRYVPLVFAKHLLQSAIKRFERDNQPELLRRVSEILATMTGGRYVEIERPTSDRSALYVRRADGVELTPEKLSTGTREQLYLAIRLGYVLHYCQQTEPLPIVMDDVLVNFDTPRALATLHALRDVSQHAQILFFTCHQHVVELVSQVFPQVEAKRL